MRTLSFLAIALTLLPVAAEAAPRSRQRPAPAPVAAPVDPAAPVPPTETELLAAATAQLDAARAEVLQLRPLAQQAEIEKAATAELRARNARLVTIARELLAAYEARYGKTTRFAPFNRARVKFETELQKTGDAIYENQADAVPVRTNEVNAAPEAAETAPKPQ